MSFVRKTRQEIADSIIQTMLDRSSELSAVGPGDPLRMLIEDGDAPAIQDVQSKVGEVMIGSSLVEATGADLVRIAQDWGIAPNEAVKASVILRLTAPTSPSAYVDVPLGSRFWRSGASGNVVYETDQTPAIHITGEVASAPDAPGDTGYIKVVGAGWAVNAYKDMTCVITAGIALQARRISRSTDEYLYFDEDLTVPSVAGVVFDVVSAKIPKDVTDTFVGSLGVEVTAKAVDPGLAGNCAKELIVYGASFPAPITAVTHMNPAYGGLDKEGDASLARRTFLRRAANCGVSADGIAARVVDFEDTTGKNPLRSAGTIVGVGTVDVYIDDGSGDPSASLVGEVQEWVDGVWTSPAIYGAGAAGITRTVHAAMNKLIKVNADVTLREGVDPSSVQTAVRQAIWGYVQNQLGVGENFYPRSLLAAIQTGNYLDVDLEIYVETGGAYIVWAGLDKIDVAANERIWMNVEPTVTTA